MDQSKYVKNLSKHEMRLIAKMRGINVKKSATTKKDKITYKESPFRPVIQDIKDKLSKSGDKLIKI